MAAQSDTEPLVSPILDAQRVVEILFPAVMTEVARRTANDPNKVHQLVKVHGVPFTAGVGSLPAGVDEEFAEMMQLGETGSGAGTFAWYPHHFDYIRETDNTLPRFTIRDGDILANMNGAPVDAVTIDLAAVTIPQAPATASDPIDARESILDDALLLTSAVLKGEVVLRGVSSELLKKPAKS